MLNFILQNDLCKLSSELIEVKVAWGGKPPSIASTLVLLC